jgi:hypothetical protein
VRRLTCSCVGERASEWAVFVTRVSCLSVCVMWRRQVCCTSPARIARIAHVAGSLEAGRRGNFLLLNDNAYRYHTQPGGGGSSAADRDTSASASAGGGEAEDVDSGTIDIEQVWIAGKLYFLRQQAL